MQERDRSAEPKADEQVRRRNWIKEAQRHLVEIQLEIDQFAEALDPAFELQPLGSNIRVSSRYDDGELPQLTLVIPEWPPKLRPHEVGMHPGLLRKEVRLRWETMIHRALKVGGLEDFHPRWREATILFTFFVPEAKLGDPDHFAHTFIINALRKFGVIEDDGWQNVTIGGMRVFPASIGDARTEVMVVKGHHWPSSLVGDDGLHLTAKSGDGENPFANRRSNIM